MERKWLIILGQIKNPETTKVGKLTKEKCLNSDSFIFDKLF